MIGWSPMMLLGSTGGGSQSELWCPFQELRNDASDGWMEWMEWANFHQFYGKFMLTTMKPFHQNFPLLQNQRYILQEEI